MRQANKLDRPVNACPECWTSLDNIGTSLYICKDDDEALRIVNFIGRSILAKIGDTGPRRVHIDGSFSPRPDIKRSTKFDSPVWFTANGLALEEVRLAWGVPR